MIQQGSGSAWLNRIRYSNKTYLIKSLKQNRQTAKVESYSGRGQLANSSWQSGSITQLQGVWTSIMEIVSMNESYGGSKRGKEKLKSYLVPVVFDKDEKSAKKIEEG